jgi:hypothetical protein
MLSFEEVPVRLSWSVPVLLVLAALAGYAARARPVQAQVAALPFTTGDTVVISLQGGGSRECHIEVIRGMFARCGNPSESQGVRIGDRRTEAWVNVAVVEWVTKARE